MTYGDEYDWPASEIQEAARIMNALQSKPRRHGLTLLEAAQIRLDVGRCELCGALQDLTLDHDHDTDELRGVLCQDCNRRLSGKWEDADFLQGVIEYLNRPKSQRPRRP